MTGAPGLSWARSGRGPVCPRSAMSAISSSKTRSAVQCDGLIAGGVDAIIIETCQDPLQIKAAVNGAKRARDDRAPGHADPGSGHDRDHRDPVGRGRHRRGGDDHPRPRRADDRAQLRDRPARDGRARQMARRELAGPHLGAAQCRIARAGRRPCPLPARPGRARAMARTLCRRGRGRHDRRLLRHRSGAYRGTRRDAAAARRWRWRWTPAARPAHPPSGLGALRRLALWPGGIAPGECLAVDRRALQRQRLAQIPPAAGCRATGTAASRWAASRSRKARTRSICAPPLSGATRSPT